EWLTLFQHQLSAPPYFRKYGKLFQMIIDPSIFAEIEANLSTLDVDEIKKRLDPFMRGRVVTSPIIPHGTFLYRARRVTSTFNKGIGIKKCDLIYPPAHSARLGRLNRDGQSLFYCSVHKPSVFYELQGLQKDEEIILTFWKTTEKMFVNNIGY